MRNIYIVYVEIDFSRVTSSSTLSSSRKGSNFYGVFASLWLIGKCLGKILLSEKSFILFECVFIFCMLVVISVEIFYSI